MAIDDPQDAIDTQLQAEERAASPVHRHLVRALEVLPAGLLSHNLITVGLKNAVLLFVNREREARKKVFTDVLVDELRYVKDRLRDLTEESVRFIREEFPALVIDALEKAERTRARDRIERIGRIVAHAAEAGPRDGADCVEEMSRIAMDLTQRDVALLRDMERAHPVRHSRNDDRYIKGSAISVWDRLNWKERGYSEQEVESICCKLQSFGLVSSLDLGNRRPAGRHRANKTDTSSFKRGWTSWHMFGAQEERRQAGTPSHSPPSRELHPF